MADVFKRTENAKLDLSGVNNTNVFKATKNFKPNNEIFNDPETIARETEKALKAKIKSDVTSMANTALKNPVAGAKQLIQADKQRTTIPSVSYDEDYANWKNSSAEREQKLQTAKSKMQKANEEYKNADKFTLLERAFNWAGGLSSETYGQQVTRKNYEEAQKEYYDLLAESLKYKNVKLNKSSDKKNNQIIEPVDTDNIPALLEWLDNGKKGVPNDAKGLLRTGQSTSYHHISDDETKMLFYLYNTEGEDAVKNYLNYLQPQLNQRMTEKTVTSSMEYAQKNPLAASGAAIVANVGKGAGVGEDLINALSGKPIDVNSSAHQASYVNRAIISQVSNDITEETKDIPGLKQLNKLTSYLGVENIPAWLYQVGNSVINSAVNTFFAKGLGAASGLSGTALNEFASNASSVLMFSQVAQDSVIEAKENGLSDNDAVSLGIVRGLFEGITEKYSLDNILDNPNATLSNFIKSPIKRSMIAEGSEEWASNQLNRVADLLYYGDETDIKKNYDKYISEGKSKDAAFAAVIYDMFKEDASAFLGGAISGGGMYAFYGMLGTNPAKVGKAVASNDMEEQIINIALSMNENTEAYQLAKSVSDSGKISPYDIGKIAISVLSETNQQQNGIISEAVYSRVKELGGSSQDADIVSSYIANSATNQKIKKTERNVAINNQYYSKITEEMKNADNNWFTEIENSLAEIKSVHNNVLYAVSPSKNNKNINEESRRGLKSKSKNNSDDAPTHELLSEKENAIINNDNKTNAIRGEDNGSTNAEVLAGGKVSTVNGGRNGIRQQSENTRKIEDFLRDGKETQGTHRKKSAGVSGWLHTRGERESGFEISRGASFLRGIRGIELNPIDTVGRTLSDELQDKLKDTVLKDENGRILSLYHFTDSVFDIFADGDIGFHFGTLDAANNRRNDPYRKKRGDAVIYKETYINMQNPLMIDGDRGVWDAFTVGYFLLDLKIFSETEMEQLERLKGFHKGNYNSEASVKLRELIKEKGYDGIIYTNAIEDDISVIAFDADQIITVAENGILKENCGVTEAVSADTDSDTDYELSDNDMYSKYPDSGAENRPAFTDVSTKEIYREPTFEDTLAQRDAKQRHITDIAKKLDSDMDIFWVEKNSPKLNGKNGKYVRSTNMMYLAKDVSIVEMYFEVFKHEFVHRLESRGTYKSFKEYLINRSTAFEHYARAQLKILNGGQEFEGSREEVISSLTQHYYNQFVNDKSIAKPTRDKFTMEDAEREIVADFVGEVLFKGKENRADIAQALSEGDMLSIGNIESSMDALEELANTDRNLFQKIVDVIKEFIRKLSGSPQTKRLVSDLEYIEQRLARVYDSRDTQKAIRNAPLEQNYSSGSRGGENLYDTPEHLKPDSEQEWSEFNRSFANQTNGLKNGKTKNIIVMTSNSIYSVYADGYMSGIIESKEFIDDYIEWRDMYYGEVDTSSELAERNEIERLQRRNNSWNSDIYERGKSGEKNDGMDSEQSSEQSGSIERNGEDTEGGQFSLNSPMQQARENLAKYESGQMSREEYLAENERLWGDANEKYGIMKQGENADAPISTPEAVSDDTENKQFVRTLLETGKLTPEMVENVQAQVLLGDFSYKPISDEKAMQKADTIVQNGTAESVWEDAVNDGKRLDKNQIAVGERLLADAIKAGDTYKVLEISSQLADILTRAGQVVQAARLLKKMTGAGRLVTAQRMVETLNKSMREKYGYERPDIKISPKAADRLAKAKTEKGIEHAYQEILQEVADQVPVTFIDKWNAWRYFAMLSNPKTHIRNLVGNGIFVPVVRIKDFIATGIEAGASAAGLIDKSDRTKSIIIKKEYAEFAKNDGKKDAVQQLLKGNKYNDKSAIKEKQQIFKTQVLEFLTRVNSNALEMEDMLFKNKHYIHALAGFLQARNVDLKTVSEDVLTEARIYAVNEAKKATFNDESALADWVQNFGNKNLATSIMVEGTLPFKRTLINIVKRGVEYSPLGLGKTLTKGVYDVKKGKITPTEFIDGLASGLTGTGIMLAGMFLASIGCISGGEDDDKLSNFEKWLGKQEYAVEFLGKSYTIDWAAPACISFFIGAEIVNTLNEGEDFRLSQLGNAVWNSLEPITNLSMLSGIQSVIESTRYAESSQTLAAIAGDAITSYAMQGIPSLLGAVSRTIDPTQRSWYTDKNDKFFDSFSQSISNNVRSKIPGLSYTQIPKIDPWGREVSRGGVGERVLENFVSPGYYSEIEYNETSEELKRIFVETGGSVFPQTAEKSISVGGETKYLTADEYVTYAKAKGEYSFDYIKEFMDSTAYDKLTDDQRAKVIENLYKFANAKAKSTVSDYDPAEVNTFKTVTRWERSGKSAVIYYIASATD